MVRKSTVPGILKTYPLLAATFSDCQALIDPATWDSAWAADTNVCHYKNPDDLFSAPAVAYNTACHGNCCVYYASKVAGGKPDKGKTLQDAASLMGCADTAKNKINGMLYTEQAYGVCISNGNGCGDCFGESGLPRRRFSCRADLSADDKDFSGGCGNC